MWKKKPLKVILSKSKRKDKKWVATMHQLGHKHNFGQKDSSTFIDHKDVQKKDNYIRRHKKNENWNDIHSAGFWSKNLLWNKPTISASIKDIEKRFNLQIKKI